LILAVLWELTMNTLSRYPRVSSLCAGLALLLSGLLMSASTAHAQTACQEYRTRNDQHVEAGRATTETKGFWFWKTTVYYATGSEEYLGTDAAEVISLLEESEGVFVQGRCFFDNGACHTASNAEHTQADRAILRTRGFLFWKRSDYFALGSDDALGSDAQTQNSLQETAVDYWVKVDACNLTPHYTLSTHVTGEGAISPDSATLEEGSTQEFTLTPAEGYEIREVFGCGGQLDGQIYTTAPASEDCTVSVRFTVPNRPPVAEAGDAFDAPIGTWTSLAGEGTDPDGDTLSYSWQANDADYAITFEDPDAAQTTFKAEMDTVPQGEQRTTTFTLTVTDPFGLTSSDTVEVTLFGLGTTVNPFKVSNYDELKKVGTNIDGWTLTAHYEQTAPIDASASETENEGKGFRPIAWWQDKDITPFTGSYNGNNHSITNLHLNYIEDGYIGLFGMIENSTLKNIRIFDARITGEFSTGTLVGEARNSTIENCFTSGEVSIPSNTRGTYMNHIGGMIGAAHGFDEEEMRGRIVLKNLHSEVNLTLDLPNKSLNGAGVIAGYIGGQGELSDTVASGSITVLGAYQAIFVGGLTGTLSNEIDTQRIYASGSIDIEAGTVVQVGGLAGQAVVSSLSQGISAVDLTLDVTVATEVGGAFGLLVPIVPDRHVDQVASYGSVTVRASETGTVIGGLTGRLHGPLTNAYARGAVTAQSRMGGLIGMRSYESEDDRVVNCYATGQVIRDPDGFDAGGLIGTLEEGQLPQTENSFWDIQTSGLEISAGGEGLETHVMQMRDTYTQAGWDFETVWAMETLGDSLPKFQWLIAE
jgi:hypothetical protein